MIGKAQAEFGICFLIGAAIALAVGTVFHVRPWESPTTRAYRLCGACGHSEDAVDRMIDDCRHSTLDRGELFRLWEATYGDPADLQQGRELCGPCIETVLQAAARMDRTRFA